MDLLWHWLQILGDLAVLALAAAIGLYFIPGSPVRKAVEQWVERRVSLRFDKELETFRHRLALDAERVRAEHQQALHNSALVTERRHEVFRELFKLLHMASGAVGGLSGLRHMPTFEDYNPQDLLGHLTRLSLPGKTIDQIMSEWDTDRANAIRELNAATRRVEVARSEQAYAEAWNYFLLNSLYLEDRLSIGAAEVFKPLSEILAFEMFPEPGHAVEIGQLKKSASELLERLRRDFREALRVTDDK